ncbi:MAG: CDP-diacylglycerol--glycerol-3-phosphate 3-phosphatidyltransferase [Pseudohongiellaceae bacterium]|jgi:CDP-diacylglycerol--glycerol-3-phosphate 3-phosphatidyltransferase
MNLPNILTLFRILLIPLCVLAFYLPYSWSYTVSAMIFALAGLTDWLDGYIARKLNMSTAFGAFLDPVADKLMVVIVLVLLVERMEAWWFTLPAMVIIGREILISALREWMAELGKRTSVAVSNMGKFKTGLQMLSIFILLIAAPERSGIWVSSGIVVMYIAAALTLWSMLVYLKAAAPEFRLNAE